MKKLYRYLSVLMFLLTLLPISFLLIKIFLSHIPSMYSKSFLLLSSFLCICLFLYFGFFFYSKYKQDEKYMKWNLKITFWLYVILLFSLTIFVRSNFHITKLIPSLEELKDTLKISNFIPFKETIHLLLETIENGRYSHLFLIFGNMICFIPFAYFLPRIFPKEKKYKTFIITVFCITFVIEFTQFITANGVFDIDDILYNALGAIICFPIFNKTFFGKFIDSFFLLSKVKLKKKEWFLSLSFICVLFICFGLSGYFYFVHDSATYYEIELIDDSKECTQNEKEYFYEDENYKYYFNCPKSNKVFIEFTKNKTVHKYLLTDVLLKKINLLEYEKVNIENLIDEKIIFAEQKNDIFTIEYQGDYGFATSYKIENPILNIKESYTLEKENTFYMHYTCKPIKPGKTNVIFYIRDVLNDTERKSILYEVIIDENLKFQIKKIK